MRTLPLLALAFCFLTAPGLFAADLTTRDGQVYHNYKVVGHDAGSITIMDSDGGQKIPLSNLPADMQKQYGYDPAKSDAVMEQQTAADEQQRKALAAAQVAAQQQQQQQRAAAAASAATAAPQSLSAFASQFVTHLFVMKLTGTLQGADLRALTPVKYWAFYYSASWCPPCRQFSPQLVSFYKQFKPKHPNFEIVLVSDDRTEPDMLNYMKNDRMEWPALKFIDLHDPSMGIQKYCGQGIPCLVLVDENGKVLSDTYRGGQYQGPEVVVDDIQRIVK